MVFKQRHTSADKLKLKLKPEKRRAIVKAQKPAKRKKKASITNSLTNGKQWQTAMSQAIWFNSFLDSTPGPPVPQLDCSPPLSEECFVELRQERQEREPHDLSSHVKSMFKEKWQDSLCKADGDKETGSPALLILCSSATRCVDLLKELRSLTKVCKPAKLFAKHIKVEEQVKMLQDYVNIAIGTPNRVKKLIDLGALGLESLEIILLDVHEDAKGFTIFTMPQVKADLLELCKSHLCQWASEGRFKFCLC